MVKNQRNSCCHMGCPPMIGDLHFHRGYSLRLQESKPLKNNGIISQACYRCPANRGESHNGAALGSDLEMVLPPVCTWVEQTHHCCTRGITVTDVHGLIEVAGAAGQRPVRRGVLATTADRHDMLHLQGKVEHGFWPMAVLTPMP